MTVGTSRQFWYWKFALLWSDLQENTGKVLHESGPILHEGGPAERMVLKAISKNGFSGFTAVRE